MGIKVTVVVPIYNVEKYLNKCIESIVNQTYENLEIILVDDGSPDNCPAICELWAEKDSRIRVIHKENQGLGMARNTGIENATGEYICFFDSDDYIALELIENCVKAIQETDSDAVMFKFTNFSEKAPQIDSANTGFEIYKGRELREKLLPDLISRDYRHSKISGYAFSAWSYLFSLSMIKDNNLLFVSEREIISEDTMFLIEAYSKFNKIAVIPRVLYYHYVNDNSLTFTFRKDRQEKNLIFLKEAIKLSDRVGYAPIIKNRLTSLYHSFTIAALKQLLMSEIPDKKILIKNILSDKGLRETLKYNILVTEKKKIAIFFLFAKFRLYYLCYLMLKIKADS